MLAFRGDIIHSTSSEALVVLRDHIIGVDSGQILFVERGDALQQVLTEYAITEKDIRQLNTNEFLMPGLIDTHIHAPQYVNAGTGLGVKLLDWLKRYTYPAETRFEDLDYAEDVCTKVVARTLRNGTTTACYFNSLHCDATIKLCQVVEKLGQRALVGKVNMDCNSSEEYVETTENSVSDTLRFIEYLKENENPLIQAVVTPRFAPTCTSELMTELGTIAKNLDLHIQTHCSENKEECSWVKELFPQDSSYAEVYDKRSLLTNKSIMAHCVYLSDEDLELFKARGAGIAHCPNSNTSLKSGHLDARRVLDFGVKLGLGTDISGGYSPSILCAMRDAIQTSHTVSMTRNKDYQTLEHREAFRLATLGGAEVLGLHERTGNFEVGKDFDALVINLEAEGSPVDIFPSDTLDDKISKFFYIGDDRNVQEVFVSGRRVVPFSR